MSVFDDLLAQWNEQQRIFMAYREHRVAVMAKAINHLVTVTDRPIRVLDLGCGPGSVSHQILELVPDCQVVGVDRDPLLLRIAKETNPHPDRFQVVDANLMEKGWSKALPFDQFDAMVSATALHWLPASDLVAVYHEAASIMRPGGVLLNADHMYYAAEGKPILERLAETLRDAHKVKALEAGALDWESWWDNAKATPALAEEAALHEERWSHRHDSPHLGPIFHLEALKAVGCIEADVIWRDFDDIVLCGVLPA